MGNNNNNNNNNPLLVIYVDAKYANEETVAVFFFPDRGQMAQGGVLSPPTLPHQWSVYYLLTPGPFNYPPAVTESQLQLLIGSLLGKHSTSPQATYQNLLQ